MDDQVAGRELQGVDGAATARGHARRIAHGRPLPEEIGLRDEGHAATWRGEAPLPACRGDDDSLRARLRRGHVIAPGRRDALVAQRGRDALGRARALGEQDHAVSRCDPGADVLEHLGQAAATVREGAGIDGDVIALLGEGVRGPHRPARTRGRFHLADGSVRRGREIQPVDIEGRGRARGRAVPGGLEELQRGAHEVLGARADPLGIAQEHEGSRGEHVDEEFHALGKDGREGFHPIDDEALGHSVEDLRRPRMRRREDPGPCAHLGGEQQLACGVERDPAHVMARSLVGHREVADLLDRVAPQLDAHRVLGGRGEDVEDAAAHGELAPALDQVDA